MVRRALATFILAIPGGAAQAAAPCPGDPQALGVSREIAVGAGPAGLAIGLKSYPRTLALEKGEVVLTFDDGPAETTTAVLDALKQECVKATFFLIGRNAAAHPALVKREVAEGHTVGHHSFSHPFITMRGLGDEKAEVDIDKGFAADDLAAYGSVAGAPRVPFFRFPGFADTPGLDAWLGGRGITIFGADLWASDWVTMTPQVELALLMRRLEAAGKGIILLHDARKQTAQMMPALLAELKRRGFHVVHMVPGAAPPPLAQAAPGWTSDTEAAIAKVWPKIGGRASRWLDGVRRARCEGDRACGAPKTKRRSKRSAVVIGAAKRTRTSTPVKGLAPQASASTSSAMAASMRAAQGLLRREAARLTNRPPGDKGEACRRWPAG